MFDGSSLPMCYVEKVYLEISQKFTGKHLCQNLFFNKVAGLGPATLLKKRLWHRCFHVKFPKFLRTLSFTEHLGGWFWFDWVLNMPLLIITKIPKSSMTKACNQYFQAAFRLNKHRFTSIRKV